MNTATRTIADRAKGVGAYLIASALIAIICMAFAAPGPEDMIATAFIVWAPPAILAIATSGKQSLAARYAPPAIALGLMIIIMWNGMR